MAHLYEITDQARQLAEIAAESDEDMAQAIADTWEAIEGEFEDKAISLIHVTHAIKGDTDQIAAEIKRLQARKKAFENKVDSLKSYLRTNMEASGITKIECPLFSITLVKPQKIVIIDNEEKIPPDFLRITTAMAPMKKEILDALKKDPDSVPGCTIGESKSRLLIR